MENNKTEVKTIRFTKERKELIEQRAGELGLNSSQYINFLISQDLDKQTWARRFKDGNK